MSFAYELINPPATGMTAPGDRVFIYVLMFNITGYPSKPFYVGQARKLTQRFSNHQMITWHVARFGAPPKIFVAGHVPSESADHAEQNLIARLSRSGYRLTNTMVIRAGKIVRRPTPFLMEHREATLHHLNSPAPRESVLLAWQAQFDSSESHRSPVTGSELLPEEVHAYIHGLDHSSPEAKAVSELIAGAFDPGFQGSNLDLASALKGQHSPKDLQRLLMRLRDVWVFRKGLQAGKVKGYRLTKRHTAAVLAARPQGPALRS